MLQQVEVWPASEVGTPLVLDIDGVDPDSTVLIKSISGLDPADVTLFTGEYARDGGYYQGRRSGQRNIVMLLKLNPDYANDVEVSDIREDLYGRFMDPDYTESVKLVFKDDRKPDRFAIGHAEKAPSDIFVKDPTMQVSLICPNPFLLSTEPETGVDVAGWTTLPLDYEGSARTGISVNLKVTTATSVIKFEVAGQIMTLNGTFAVDDIISIDTNPGSRAIRQNGSDIMARLVAGSQWARLSKGTNLVRVSGSVVGDGKVVMTQYAYQAAWWGV